MEENYTLAKWLNNELSATELKEFQSSDDFLLYEKIKNHTALLKTSDFDKDKMLETIVNGKKAKIVPFYNTMLFKIAAVFIIALGLTFFIKTNQTETINVGNGVAIVEVNLPDSSIALVNDGSKLNYSKWNWKNNRKLNLIGEAFFKVQKGKSFEVNTSLGKVTVLGTQFNVKSRNKRFDVTCFKGKVKVNYNKFEVILVKGETVSFENDKQIISHEINDENPSWLNQNISFEEAQFTEIVEEIERQYDVTIVTKKDRYSQLFTGKIPSDDIKVALQIIASSYHIKIIKTSENSYTLEESK